MNTDLILPGFDSLVKPFKFPATPHEFKVTALRECPTPDAMQLCDTPDKAADYWRLHITSHSYFNPECECFAVFLLNARRRVKGHHIVSIGTQDTILVHAREVFRLAIMTAANAIVIAHNLCVAAHKLCYVERRFMWSHRSAVMALRSASAVGVPLLRRADAVLKLNWVSPRRGCYA